MEAHGSEDGEQVEKEAQDYAGAEQVGRKEKKIKKVQRKQYTLRDANQTRLWTKMRWAVEAYHRRLKEYAWCRTTRPNYDIKRVGQVVRVLSALFNMLRPPMLVPSAADDLCAREMLKHTADEKNFVYERVLAAQRPFSTRIKWDPRFLDMDEDKCKYTPLADSAVDASASNEVDFLVDWPKLSEQEMKDKITYGPYQVKLAKSYTHEHLTAEGKYVVEVHKQAPDFLRVRIHSRFTNSKVHYTWIHWSSEAVLGWYCTCPVGMRTVGCCAHVAAVIWFLSIARHEPKKYLKRRQNFWTHLLDARAVAVVEGEEMEGDEGDEAEEGDEGKVADDSMQD